MDVHVGSTDGPTPSLAAVADQFNREIRDKQTQWLETLAADPSRFGEVEQEIHLAFSKMADQAAAAILVKTSERPEMQSHQKKSWRQRLRLFASRRSAR